MKLRVAWRNLLKGWVILQENIPIFPKSYFFVPKNYRIDSSDRYNPRPKLRQAQDFVAKKFLTSEKSRVPQMCTPSLFYKKRFIRNEKLTK